MAGAWDEFEALMKEKMRETYSEAAIDHAMNPRNLGELDDANGFGRITGPCGDTMSIWLRIEGDVILAAGFTTDGCGTTLASGSMVTELAEYWCS